MAENRHTQNINQDRPPSKTKKRIIRIILFFACLFVSLFCFYLSCGSPNQEQGPNHRHFQDYVKHKEYLAVTSENALDFIRDYSCSIQDDRIVVSGYMEQLPESDDEYLYLLNYHVWEEDDPDTDGAYLKRAEKMQNFQFETPLRDSDAYNNHLYDRFQTAVKIDDEFIPISKALYLDNPEGAAACQTAFPEAASIKGLLIDPLRLSGPEVEDLGIKHAIYNIPFSMIIGKTSDPRFPTTAYRYNGRVYNFNTRILLEFDYAFQQLTQKGLVTTAVLLNDKNPEDPTLIHPWSRNGSGYYYAFNAYDREGCELLAATVSFLASRYNGSGHGLVSNWVFGNEINVLEWNYMEPQTLEAYTGEYAKAFRIAYNAIRSENANARVYISLDQQWNKNEESDKYYDAKDVLDRFNALILAQGDIDWGVAYHPYSVPMTWPKFWSPTAKYRDMVLHDPETPMICMANVEVLTDYMQRPELRSDDGQIRHIILSELGFTSSFGEELQAAACAYAYYIAANNPHIDAFLLSRETDAPEEARQGLALGLSTYGGKKKYAYEIYKKVDAKDFEASCAFALPIIGCETWEEALPVK